MQTGFAPPATTGLRSGFAIGVVRRRPPSRLRFAQTRCCALEQSEKVADPEVPLTEGSVGNPAGDEYLLAVLDRDWDVLENFDGALDEPIETDVEDQVLERDATATALQPENSKDEKEVSAEAASTPSSNIADFSNTLHEVGESSDINVAIAEAKKGKEKKDKDSEKGKKYAISGKVRPKTAAEKKAEAKMESEKLAAAALWDRNPKWFFLQTKPGCEQSCAISLRNLASCMPQLQIKEVMVPAMKIMRLTKAGQSVKKEERIYPSYILIHMVMDHSSYSQVQNVPNVQFFMGDPNRDKKKNQPFRPPLPVSESELSNVFHRMRTAEEARPEAKTTLRPGNMVRILDGKHAGRYATINEVRPDLNTVTVKLQVFAREVNIEFGISEVVKEDPPLDHDLGEVSDGDEPVGSETRDVAEADPVADASVSPDVWPVNEEEVSMPEQGKVSTVLDTLDETQGAPEAGQFDDLLGDDLPDLPLRFESPRKKSSDKTRSAAKDPVQDLLDMFDDSRPEDILDRIDEVDPTISDSGFAEAEIISDEYRPRPADN